MIEQFLTQLFLQKNYSPELILIYILSGILAGLTRLTIRDESKTHFNLWWADGSLLGALIISIVGAIVFDNSFLWSFLGGYFFVYIISYIQKGLEKVLKTMRGGDSNNDGQIGK